MDKSWAKKVLTNENLSIDEIAELSWILNSHLYKERPVTIEEFCSSDDFVHKKWPNIFPLWKKTLKELFPTPFNAPFNEVLISAAAGAGKCLAKGTPILMYDGTIKNVENVRVGDFLLGPDNNARLVVSLGQGKELMYRVILQDGSYFDCNKSHILSLKHCSTYDILNINIEEYLKHKELYEDYKSYKIDKCLYDFEVIKLEIGEYYGFTIVPIQDNSLDNMEHCFVLGNGIVTHNTVTATISVLYDMYKLGCLKDPCSFYGLTPDTMIIMAIFSATGSTAAVNWNDITTGIESCPWMMDKIVDKRGLEKKYGSIVPVEILPGIFIQTGSKFQHSMGKAIFDGLMDEAAFGGSNSKDAQKSYNELSSRMKTRFGTFSESGSLPGHLFLISSPKEAGDFMQYRIEKAKEAGSKYTKIIQNIATWDADPRKDSEDKFTVFIGNENKEPCIYEPEADVPIEELDYLIYPPMRYYEEFKKDLLISIMNYGGITTTSDMALFKSPTLLNDVFVLNNPFYKDVIELPFAKTDKQIMDFCDLEFFKNIRHPEYNRFIHLDAAYSTNTLDVYGLAASYCITSDMTTFTNETNNNVIEKSDVFVKKDRQYFVDFVVGITAPKGQEVPLYKIQDFIEYLIKNLNYPVASISADQFQSKQTLQTLQTKGYETENISVDKTRDPYLFLRMLVHNKQVLMAKNERAKKELKGLRDDGKKIDHTVNCFTKDTKIKLLDGRDISIEQLLVEQTYKQNWVYTFNETTQKIEPKKIKHVFQSGITKKLVKVTLDNGEIITCTPEHLFMLRDGSYEQIQNLTPGTSLMPLYTKVSEKGLNGYRLYYEPMEDKWHYEHRMFSNPDKEKTIVHHCNYNKLDNTPTNLKPVTRSQHQTIHNNNTVNYSKTAKSVALYHERMKNTPEYRERSRKISQKCSQAAQRKFDALPEQQKLQKLKEKENQQQFIRQIEQYFNISYSQISPKQRSVYTMRYKKETDPQFSQNIKEKLSEAHKQGRYKKIQEVITQKRWITNGEENKYIFKHEQLPNGFWYGRTLSEQTKQRIRLANKHLDWSEERKKQYKELHSKNTSNRRWITNGKEDRYILKDSPIPEGFKPGRCKVGKNHKIVQIEFINYPCKVYDLEIEDNHNFALSAGVIVHNSTKDCSDAICGSIWNCANSNNIVSRTKVTRALLNPQSYEPQQLESVEMMEFERLKQSYASGLFKGL